MNGEIICVGTELLLGDIVNTNAQFLSTELALLGINVYNQSVVGDNENRIKQLLSEAVRRSRIIVLTGGLGPTEDDLTKESVAAFFGLPLIEDAESRKHIEEYFKRTARRPAAGNFKQALAPMDAHIFKNDVGTAPGYAIENGGCTVIILPGPPSEMQHMFKNYVRPYLEEKSDATLISHNINIFGEMESSIEERIKHFTKLSNPTTAPYAKEGEVRLRVTASAQNASAAENICKPVIKAIKATLGDCVYGVDSRGLNYEVVELLKKNKMKVATAESCTAGLLSSMITEVSGSSEVFDFGISAYANHIKTMALGVPENIIKKYGAVSEHTAAYMALGVRKLSNADIGIGITGVAGPGASENKPVGLVYIALADKENIWVRKTTLGHGSDEREKVRRNSAKTALDLIRRYLCSLPEVMPGGFKVGTAPSVLTAQPSIAGFVVERPEEITIPQKRVFPIGAENSVSDREMAELIKTVADSEYDVNSYTATHVPHDSGFQLTAEDPEADSDIPQKESFLRSFLALRPDDGSILEGDNEEQNENGNSELVADTDEQENSNRRRGLKAFLSSLWPRRTDRPVEKARKSVFLAGVSLVLLFAVVIGIYFGQITASHRLGERLRDIYKPSLITKNQNGEYSCFEPLLAENPNTAAWIKINGTEINNPVVYGLNNKYYNNHSFDDSLNRYGTLFFDAHCQLDKDYRSQNLVVFGNNMSDGTMFGGLKKYKNVNYYIENPLISLRTLYNDKQYKIFAVVITNSKKEHDNGMVFDYSATDFPTQHDFLDWIEDIKERSIFDTGVDVAIDEQILTLLTESNEFDGARLVIYARQLRPSESLDVDETEVKVNASPRYPQIYYDIKGIKNPYADDSFYGDPEDDDFLDSSDLDSSDTDSSDSGIDVDVDTDTPDSSDIENGPLGYVNTGSVVSGLSSDFEFSSDVSSSDISSDVSSADTSSENTSAN